MKKAVIAIVIALILALIPLVVLANTQRWYCHNNNTMYKFNYNQSPGLVVFDEDQYYIWYANEESAGMTFPGGTWNLYFSVDEPITAQKSFEVYIGYGDGSGTFTSRGQITISGEGGKYTYDEDLVLPSFTVSSGDYLAMKVQNTSSIGIIKVETGQNHTYINSPSTDPGYPVPELTTIILLGSGLTALACYLIFRRRGKSWKTA